MPRFYLLLNYFFLLHTVFFYIYIYICILISQRASGCESTTTAIAGHRRDGAGDLPTLPCLTLSRAQFMGEVYFRTGPPRMSGRTASWPERRCSW